MSGFSESDRLGFKPLAARRWNPLGDLQVSMRAPVICYHLSSMAA